MGPLQTDLTREEGCRCTGWGSGCWRGGRAPGRMTSNSSGANLSKPDFGKCEGMFGVNERKHLRKKSEKDYKEIIDIVCLETLKKRHDYLNLMVRFPARDLGELSAEGGETHLTERGEVSALNASVNAPHLHPFTSQQRCWLSRWRKSSVLPRNFVHVVRLLKK